VEVVVVVVVVLLLLLLLLRRECCLLLSVPLPVPLHWSVRRLIGLVVVVRVLGRHAAAGRAG